jgi:hypothetical protein
MRDLLSGGQRSFCQFLRRFVGDYVAVELVVLCANMDRRADPIKHSVLVATISYGLSVQFNLQLAFLFVDRSVKTVHLWLMT